MPAKQPFKFWTFFFSSHGRVSRKAYALFELPAMLIVVGVSYAARLVMFSATSANTSSAVQNLILVPTILGILSLILLWPRFAVAVKRLHDVDIPWYGAGVILLVPALSYAFGTIAAHDLTAGDHSAAPAVNYLVVVPGVVYYATNLFVLVLCLLPPRPSASRYGPDPRHPDKASSDVF